MLLSTGHVQLFLQNFIDSYAEDSDNMQPKYMKLLVRMLHQGNKD